MGNEGTLLSGLINTCVLQSGLHPNAQRSGHKAFQKTHHNPEKCSHAQHQGVLDITEIILSAFTGILVQKKLKEP